METPDPDRPVERVAEGEEAEPRPVTEIAVGPAVQAYVPPPVDPPAGLGNEAGDAGLAAARAGRLIEAQKHLSDAVRKGVAGPRAHDFNKAVGDVADRLLFSPATPASYPFIKTYEVVSGDMLAVIGRRFLVPYELVMKMNRLASDRINVGQKLRVLQGPHPPRNPPTPLRTPGLVRRRLPQGLPYRSRQGELDPAGQLRRRQEDHESALPAPAQAQV